MRADEYKVLTMCVETGVRRGWTRAHKHNEAPDDQQICDAIERAVTDEICEWFLFEPESEGGG